ncbi:amino acid adenylation domain-containing protein [Nonomuraea aurantiaca]|uniref:amino acid adenylation domain-containing protein n=1 Tax=Nonomuraea aurantiaca TaxID=2878562 RepID=UPI001CD9AD7D|nr:amino acid adenylation domain-containing protein [Nonomuraea aurantiaca]MCA2220746.1 amino acid adenylation domain-containing protein [Nonomuraea aurantiaca]
MGALRSHGLFGSFLEVAGEQPSRPAIVDNGTTVTYAELERLASEVARSAGPGVVGVPATHSAGTVAALLGVWAAGGTYCPVDPAFPETRRRAMLDAAGCRFLLGSGPLQGREVPAGLAYVLFTSGSTGAPKPVMTSHRAIEATIRSLRELFAMETGDRVLQFASLNWDTCFEEILPTLTGGACLVFHDDAHSGSFPRFLRMVERERITVLNLPTAFWHELVTYLADEKSGLPECVRLVVIGGEAANPARLTDWHALDTGRVRLLNTYGCTETTLITHAADLHGPYEKVPIGRRLPHVAERIGEDGELLIGGQAIADGYLGLPEATAARFVTIEGERYFRTGDRVGRTPGGMLVHRGRIDDELKVRGIRVDPAEVEAHIAAHPEVGAVAVTGLKMADHTVLAAYVVPRTSAGLGVDLRDYLRDRVPAHLIPSRIAIVPDLVYTASGKVDRRRTKEIPHER